MTPDPKLIQSVAEWSQLYGLGTILAIIITMAMIWMGWYVLKTNNVREMRYLDTINGSIATMNAQILQHHQQCLSDMKSLEVAHEHQRTEHEDLLDISRRIEAKVSV